MPIQGIFLTRAPLHNVVFSLTAKEEEEEKHKNKTKISKDNLEVLPMKC